MVAWKKTWRKGRNTVKAVVRFGESLDRVATRIDPNYKIKLGPMIMALEAEMGAAISPWLGADLAATLIKEGKILKPQAYEFLSHTIIKHKNDMAKWGAARVNSWAQGQREKLLANKHLGRLLPKKYFISPEFVGMISRAGKNINTVTKELIQMELKSPLLHQISKRYT